MLPIFRSREREGPRRKCGGIEAIADSLHSQLRRRALPLPRKQAIEIGVLNLACHMPTFTQISFTLETESFERLNRRFVPRVNISLQPAQLHCLERKLEQRLKRLMHVTFTPLFSTHCIAEFRPAISEVQIEQCRSADQL